MFKYIKKYWFFALLAPLFMVGEVYMDLLQPRLMRIIVDDGVLGLSNNNVGNLNLVFTVGIQMICFVVIGGISGILSGVFANLCSQNVGNDLRKACFRRVMSFSFEQTDNFSTGSLVTRITNDITQFQNLVTQCIRGFVRTGLIFCGGIVCLLSLDLNMGAVVACSLPFAVFMVYWLVRKVRPLVMALQQKLDRVNSVMQENVTGSRVVKAYVREDYERVRFGKANEDLVNTQLKVLLLFSYMIPIISIVMNIVIVAVIKIGALRVESGAITPGSVMAAITYVSQIMHSVMMISMLFQTISRGNASANRLREILDCSPIIADGTFAGETAIRGKIEFRNVCFSYNGQTEDAVVNDVNLVIQPGETIGILGSTGSGKTSLVNLIPRFYDAISGTVLVDDVDVRDYKLADLRDKIAIALQKSELFATSIKENILWGNPNADFAEIQEAAKVAQAAEFIDGRPEGYDTLVAGKGMSLSGGQKQRLAISRAVLKEAEIMIFDDSTSALDLKTESQLYQALNEKYVNTTKIIIAQRIASVKGADRIVVFDGGRIVACGTHEDLLNESAVYRDIYNSQLKSGGGIGE